MFTALSAKNKVELIDGSAPRPLASDRLSGAWERCNNMVVSWLVHSISSSIRQNILWMDCAEEIWRDLKSRYSQGDLLRISALELEASSLNQGDLTVTNYFTQLRVIWDGMEIFWPDSYVNVRSHVLLMDPLPPINKIFSYVAQQERQYSIPDIFHAETKHNSINVVNAPTIASACAFCGRSGHTKSTCYRKHGFPNHSDSKISKSAPTRGKICLYYGNTGHTIEVCYKKHGYPPRHRFFNAKFSSANSVSLTEALIAEKEQHIGSENSEIQFTPQQYQALLALIQQPSHTPSTCRSAHVNHIGSISSSSHTSHPLGSISSIIFTTHTLHTAPWILDAGVTDHVSNSLQFFTSYHAITPTTINLPNGHCVIATHAGTVHLTSTFSLVDVLYIPSFTFNLISLSKLVLNTPYQILFTANSCLIQDTKTKMKIGSVDVKNGLYQLVPQNFNFPQIHSIVVHPDCNVLPIDLWHFHLGHLSNTHLHTMQKIYPCLTINDNFICNSCHYAKQRKPSFPTSHSHAQKPFSLLHMDIWGPCFTSSMHGHKFFLTIVDDDTRFTWIFPMTNKVETRQLIVNFIAFAENQFNSHVQIIRTDNGVEFSMH
ncbi:hypothetical protein V8G54_023186 [Vigna mungo]|uniref:Integrase catalytic domain-containing protein n=1 Tax=Vigna mungo TaxID=3915 RepID=A0AAQ3N4N5_VIGMU